MMLLHSQLDLYGKLNIANYFKMAIDNRNSDAMYTYARMLSNGERVPVDKKEASRYFKMAVDNGNSDAMFDYAIMLLKGDGIQKNETEAFHYFKLSKDKGNLDAMFNLAMMLLNGEGVTANKTQAARYFKYLADKGDSYAMYNYATMLHYGDGIQQNKDEAAKYYQKSFEEGNLDAIHNYAMNLLNECENQENKDEAICYMRLSIKRGNTETIPMYAEMFIRGYHYFSDVFDFLKIGIEKGNTQAMLLYSTILLFGIGVKRDLNSAIKYIKKAIEKGDSVAMLNYSTILLYEVDSSANKSEALNYLKKSIDKGNSEAMFQYGKMLQNGDIVPANKKLASQYFQMAIKKGNSDAMLYYDKMIANLDFVQPELKKASVYIKMEADKGNTDAMFEYAKMLLYGDGVSVNKNEALRYFKMAIDEGNSDAMFEYAKMLLYENSVSVNKDEALHYFKMAVDEGNSNAMLEYAKMLLYGDGVSVDKSEALRYFKILIDKRNSNAMYEYAKINLHESLLNFKTIEIKDIHYFKMAGYTFFFEDDEHSIKYISKEKQIKSSQTKQELKLIKEELSEFKREMKRKKDAIKFIVARKESSNQTKQELDQVKGAFDQAKSEKKQYTQSIIVGGYDYFNELGENPNNKDKNGIPIISPPVKLSFDLSSLLSYSAYSGHSVMVTSDGSLKGVGYNSDGRISSTLQKTVIKNFTDFCIKDGSGCQLAAISAVCYEYGTLYMFSKSGGNERQLVLCDSSISGGSPVFLDIGNHHPISLFGGNSHSAAIGLEGEVIFINRNSVRNSPNLPIEAAYLPDGEKASSVACCDNSVVVLSLNGRVFFSPIKSNEVLNFSIVSELSGQEIIFVSGTYEHFLAVSKKGRVFGRGSNKYGQLCLGSATQSVSSFTAISLLVRYEIRAAYAGQYHSLFETREGKILSCGYDYYGQLLHSSWNGGNRIVYSPTQTTITSGAAFCIAGGAISVVFIGSCPPNTPNTPNAEYKPIIISNIYELANIKYKERPKNFTPSKSYNNSPRRKLPREPLPQSNSPTARIITPSSPRAMRNRLRSMQKKIDEGDTNAMYSLGACYALGDGVPEDKEKALYYYDLAAERGTEMASSKICQRINATGGSQKGRSSKLSATGGSQKGNENGENDDEDGNATKLLNSLSGGLLNNDENADGAKGADDNQKENENGEGDDEGADGSGEATDLLNSVGGGLLGKNENGEGGEEGGENSEGGDSENNDGTNSDDDGTNSDDDGTNSDDDSTNSDDDSTNSDDDSTNSDDDADNENDEIPEVKHSRYAMGIDLGTTFCRYGVFHDDNIDLNSLDNVIQSAVVFDGDNRIVGIVPMSLDDDDSAVVITDIKRIIGRDFSDPTLQTFLENLPYKVVEDPETHRPLVKLLGENEDQSFSAEQITAMLLSHVKELASSQMGEEVTDAVISVPAYFTQVQRKATIDAGRIAGLNVIRIINEPAAAAVAFQAIHNGGKEEGENDNDENGEKEKEVENIVVYDFGGGKLDVSIMKVQGNDLTTVKKTGDQNLGGLDFDNKLMKLILDDFKEKTGLDAKESPAAIRRLRAEAEKLKITLSEQEEPDLHLPDFFGGKDLDFHITRKEFEDACDDLFKRAMEPITDIFDDSEDYADKTQIKKVLLCGGSSKIPRIRQQLREFFGDDIQFCDLEQDEAVCEGAAIQGAIIKGQKDNKLKGIAIHGTVLFSLGISCANGKNLIIIPRGFALPAKRFTPATTIRDNQRNVGFNIVEGERPMAADNIKLGHVTISGIQIAKRGVPKLEIAMTINEDGILIVTGRDLSTHVAVTATVENNGNLSHAAIRKMIKQAEKEKFNDDLKMKRAERKAELIYFLERAQNALDDENKTKKLKPEDKEKFTQIVNDYKDWVDKHPDEIPSAYQKKYNTLYHSLNKIIPVK